MKLSLSAPQKHGARKEKRMHNNISDQKSVQVPLSTNNTFHQYLVEHKLLWEQVARASEVPGLTVWSIDHGLAIHPLKAAQVRKGLYQLTGIPFKGYINTMGSRY